MNRILFASSYTRILKVSSFQTNCQQRLKPVYKEGGIWTNGQHHVLVQEIHSNLELHLYKDHIDFTVQAYYNPDLKKVKREIDYSTDRVQLNNEIIRTVHQAESRLSF